MTIIDDISIEGFKRGLPALQRELSGFSDVALTRAGEQIRDNPLLTLLVGFGLGVVGDFLLRRSLASAPATKPRRRARRAPVRS